MLVTLLLFISFCYGKAQLWGCNLKYGIDKPPPTEESVLLLHAQGCQHLCAQHKGCEQFRFWDNNMCSIHPSATSNKTIVLNHQMLHGSSSNVGIPSSHETLRKSNGSPELPSTTKRSRVNYDKNYFEEKRRSLVEIFETTIHDKNMPLDSHSGGGGGDGASATNSQKVEVADLDDLKYEDFQNLPLNVRGEVPFSYVVLAYTAMKKIWKHEPFVPITGEKLRKWGAVYPGRSEGRAIASLQKLGLINVRRGGGIMLKHYTPPSTSATPKLQSWLPIQRLASRAKETDPWERDLLRGKLDEVLRYVAGPRHCPIEDFSTRKRGKIPLIYVASFMNSLVGGHGNKKADVSSQTLSKDQKTSQGDIEDLSVQLEEMKTSNFDKEEEGENKYEDDFLNSEDDGAIASGDVIRSPHNHQHVGHGHHHNNHHSHSSLMASSPSSDASYRRGLQIANDVSSSTSSALKSKAAQAEGLHKHITYRGTSWEEKRPPIKPHCRYLDLNTIPVISIVSTPRLCQAKCGDSPSCAYFTYYVDSQKCFFFLGTAQRMEESSNVWCGSNPRCPHRHKLDFKKKGSTKQTDHFCSLASTNDEAYPWPWFNEFGLESLMIRRWRSDMLTCPRVDSLVDLKRCARRADIVVVPSLYMHQIGFKHINPWELESADLASINNLHKHQVYWDKLRMNYGRRDADGKIEWPVIVVHYSYVFDADYNLALIESLSMQPLSFQQRVVIGVLESNLHEKVTQRFSAQIGFSSDGLKMINLPSSSSHDLSFASVDSPPSSSSIYSGVASLGSVFQSNAQLSSPLTKPPGFRMISLPYPTGITMSMKHVNTSSLEERCVLVLFVGSLKRGQSQNTGRESVSNIIRAEVVGAIKNAKGGTVFCSNDACALCVPGLEEDCKRLILATEGDRLWELPANSVFCVEPAGDTLTRAHFYVAAHAGCIPVIFDGGDGSKLYDGQSPTYWPFRIAKEKQKETPSSSWLHRSSGPTSSMNSNPFFKAQQIKSHGKFPDPTQVARFELAVKKNGLDYSSFTMIFNVSDVIVGERSQNFKYVDQLLHCYTHQRDTIIKKREKLEKISRAFLYSPASTLKEPLNDDAFGRFSGLVAALI